MCSTWKCSQLQYSYSYVDQVSKNCIYLHHVQGFNRNIIVSRAITNGHGRTIDSFQSSLDKGPNRGCGIFPCIWLSRPQSPAHRTNSSYSNVLPLAKFHSQLHGKDDHAPISNLKYDKPPTRNLVYPFPKLD